MFDFHDVMFDSLISGLGEISGNRTSRQVFDENASHHDGVYSNKTSFTDRLKSNIELHS